MVDRECRDRYRKLLVTFHDGAITNTQLIDSQDAMAADTDDPAIGAIVREADELFDDTMRHTYRLSDPRFAELRPFVARLIEFLGTDIAYDEEQASRRKRKPETSSSEIFLSILIPEIVI